MPANLPPQFHDVEKKLKTAGSEEEKIAIYEEMLAIIPKHKGTEKLQASYKSKIAKLKAASQKKSAVGKRGPSHNVKKSGAGQLIVIGPPNVGKSSLIKTLTNADPQIGPGPFTTHTPYPAMMPYENIQVQLVDTPPITPDYMEVYHHELLKGADGAIIMIDPTTPQPLETLKSLIEKLQAKKVEFIGAAGEPTQGPVFRKRTLVVFNKADLPGFPSTLEPVRQYLAKDLEPISISTTDGRGLEELKNRVFALLHIVRVYSKAPGKKAETDSPYTLDIGSTVMDMARAVHQDFSKKLRFARIWGKHKYQGQKVNRNYVLEDEDVIELHV